MLSTPYHSLIPVFVFFLIYLLSSYWWHLSPSCFKNSYSLLNSPLQLLAPCIPFQIHFWKCDTVCFYFFFIAQLVHQACSCRYLLVAKSETPLNYLACPLKNLPLTAACLLECFSMMSMVPASSWHLFSIQPLLPSRLLKHLSSACALHVGSPQVSGVTFSLSILHGCFHPLLQPSNP